MVAARLTGKLNTVASLGYITLGRHGTEFVPTAVADVEALYDHDNSTVVFTGLLPMPNHRWVSHAGIFVGTEWFHNRIAEGYISQIGPEPSQRLVQIIVNIPRTDYG